MLWAELAGKSHILTNLNVEIILGIYLFTNHSYILNCEN